MKLIIDIDKDILTDAKNGHIRLSEIADAVIKTGTPVNIGGDTISRSALRKAFHERIWYFTKSSWDEANALIDGAPTVEAVPLDFHEKCMDKTVKELLEARPKGEYTEEHIKQAIKENFDIGYEMAKNKYERPKGAWIETQRGIHVTDYKCSCCGRTVRDDTGYDVASDYPFCHCGADMRDGGEKNDT